MNMKNRFHILSCGALAAGLLAASHASAAVTFAFDYTDAGVGFNDPTQGAARRGALEDAAGRIAGYFTSYSATINISVNGSVTDDGVLASAGSNWHAPYPGAGFGDRGDVMIKILGGEDPAAGVADGEVNWNFEDNNWALGNTIGAGQYDFISTAMHELAHALGFAAGIGQDGSNDWGEPAGTVDAAYTPMDQWLGDTTGLLINQTTITLDGARWALASVGGLNFRGANAMAAYGGTPVPLFAPNPWQDGSSGGSHTDDATFGNGTMLMNAASAPPGTLDKREFSAVELGILKDIGYINIIPETSSAALVILTTMAGLARRRRSGMA
jgi:hypothetical protein